MAFETVLSRGDVVRVKLDPVQGSEQGGERPAVVVSPDLVNRHSPVILVAAITAKKVDRVYPFEVLIDGDGGLSQRSKAMLLELRGVDRTRIVGRYGKLNSTTMTALEEALRIATGLEPL